MSDISAGRDSFLHIIMSRNDPRAATRAPTFRRRRLWSTKKERGIEARVPSPGRGKLHGGGAPSREAVGGKLGSGGRDGLVVWLN